MELRKRKRLDYENSLSIPHLESNTKEDIQIKQKRKEDLSITKKIARRKSVEKKTKEVENVQEKETKKKNIDIKEESRESKLGDINQSEKSSVKKLKHKNTTEPNKTTVDIKRLKTGGPPIPDLYPATMKTATSTDNIIPTSPIDSLLINKNILPDNIQGLKHIINNVSLKRPALKTVDSHQDINNIETMPIDCLENYLKDLNRLIKLQQKLYYQNLQTPRLLGPKHFKHLKFPDDMINLRKISYNLEKIVSYRKLIDKEDGNARSHDYINDISQYSSVLDQQKLISIAKQENLDKLNEEDATLLIANIHGIDSSLVRDLKCNNLYINGKIHFDPDYINMSELKSICRKIDKPLLREKSNNLSWPSRMRKKKHKSKNSDNNEENNTNIDTDIKEKHPSYKFHNIPLFNSI